MQFSFHRSHPVSLLCAVAVMALSCGMGSTEESVEVKELRAALAASQAKAAKLETQRIALLDSVTAAKKQNEALREKHAELTLQLEANRGGNADIEQRLLKAIRNYDLAQSEVETLSAQLIRLSEAAMTALELDRDGTDQLLIAEVDVATAMVASIESRLNPKNTSAGFASGQVVSLKPDIGLIVLDFGKNSGAQVGLPLQVTRNGSPVATATVVDVRDSISGAVLSELQGNAVSVQVGDTIRPRPQIF